MAFTHDKSETIDKCTALEQKTHDMMLEGLGITSEDDCIYSFDPLKGKPAWVLKIKCDANGKTFVAVALLVGGRVYKDGEYAGWKWPWEYKSELKEETGLIMSNLRTLMGREVFDKLHASLTTQDDDPYPEALLITAISRHVNITGLVRIDMEFTQESTDELLFLTVTQAIIDAGGSVNLVTPSKFELLASTTVSIVPQT